MWTVSAVMDAAVMADVVELACRAPSVHNSQPWRWVAGDGELRLFLDAARVPHATDHSGREAAISCGAVVDHLRVAASASGWHAVVAQFPNPNDLDHLATVRFRRAQFVTDGERARAEAIRTRRTDRLPFEPPGAWAAIEPVVRSTVDPAKAALHVLSDAARPQLAEASKLTEALRRYDTSYHTELDWWTGPSGRSDGIPRSALASDSELQRVDVARSFPGPRNLDRRTEVARDQSVILVLSTYDDTRQDAFGCGEVLSDILLEATMAGLATCTLSHLTELDASRSVIRELIGGAGEPQLLIRVGEAPAPAGPPPSTPRRPLAEVFQLHR
jgi:nitroreductase